MPTPPNPLSEEVQQALLSWQDYQETGQSLDWEQQVKPWMQSWFSDQELPKLNMPKTIITNQAQTELVCLREFIAVVRPSSAKKAIQRLIEAIDSLQTFPQLGQEHTLLKDLRQLNVSFGQSGYRIFYRYLIGQDNVIILKINHDKESG